MRLPTVRITINAGEYSLVKPGLDLLTNRLATARQGSFPNRHPWDRIDPLASNVYQDPAYDESLAQTMIEVRAKLFGLAPSRRIYADARELSIPAFALRQLHKPDPSLPKQHSKE